MVMVGLASLFFLLPSTFVQCKDTHALFVERLLRKGTACGWLSSPQELLPRVCSSAAGWFAGVLPLMLQDSWRGRILGGLDAKTSLRVGNTGPSIP